jgi:adenylate kinase family enzyme
MAALLELASPRASSFKGIGEERVRVVIIGSAGSGKTTLAKALSARLKTPLVELDALNWSAGWRWRVEAEPDAFLADVERAAEAQDWVIDGNYRRALPLVLRRATDLIWLDYSRTLVMSRVIRRSFGRALFRRELWPGTGNREDFLRWLRKDHPIRWAWDTFGRRRLQYGALFADPLLAGLRRHRLDAPGQTGALLAKLERFQREGAPC